MSAVVPQSVQDVLSDYVAALHEATPGLLEGVYLHGSLALGAYNPRMSDIDFIAITSRRCTVADLDALSAVHHTLGQRYPALHLEGSYLQWQDLGRFEDSIPPVPYIHDGVFQPGGHFDVNAITWWVLKHRGIAVVGPSPAELDIPMDFDELLVKMHQNLNTYWASFLTNRRSMTMMLSDESVEWIVLGVLRQFYTFRERDITSKIGAGVYALDHTPPTWHPLIREAISIREGKHTRMYRSNITRAVAVHKFLRYIIDSCNAERQGDEA